MPLRIPYYSRDGVEIYHGDAVDLLPELQTADLLLTDPPYGIAYEASRYRGAVFSGTMKGDEKPFCPLHLLECRQKFSVIWGANNFSDKMPVGGWLVWDKRCGESADRMFGSPFELAWTSRRTTFKIKRLQHGGAVNADGHGVRRVHPTQKPVELMRWCISLFSTAKTIVDPYVGSGTTLIAAMLEGKKAVGIELDEKYCEIAAARLESWNI